MCLHGYRVDSVCATPLLEGLGFAHACAMCSCLVICQDLLGSRQSTPANVEIVVAYVPQD